MKKITCPVCNGNMEKVKDSMPEDNIDFEAYKCVSCGEKLMNMNQLGVLAEKYRNLRKAKEVKFQKWGNSLAVRIPKELVDELHLAPKKKGLAIKEKNSLKIIIT